MGKGRQKSKQTSGQKRDAFWESLMTEKQKLVRDGLTNTGIEAQTRNEQGLTSIMVAAANGKAKSLETLLDWYKRRRLLRQRGWINLTDDEGHTALHLAAARGHLGCIETLIDFEAKTEWKDMNGKTPRDLAVQNKKTEAVKLIDEMLREPSDDDIDEATGEAYNDGLTSTQRNRLKKKQMQALERRGMKDDDDDGEKEDEEDEDDGEPGPKPIWPEVEKVVESIQNLRELKEISIVREEVDDSVADSNGVDPALWYLRGINRLEMRLAPDVLTSINGPDLKRLRNLSTLILNHNSLSSLPGEIGLLNELRFLELSHNKLSSLPESMSNLSKLELLNLDNNMFEHLGTLEGMTSLSTLRAANNEIVEIELAFEGLVRLATLSISHNKIAEIPSGVGVLQNLLEFEAESNLIEEIPYEFCSLKRVKVFKLADNPIKDPKLVKLLKKNGALKDIWKYIEKAQSKKSDKQKDNSPSKKEPETASENVTPTHEYDSDDSFDITMEEL
uniref:Uncharacterized protein n=1 Tax=Aplanochytrium stocchinoi TaxID=215587 RepID=A0A7S3LPC5_9STRA|mmetsp:Transcript_26786/g.32465  ORF Transcript_26786/g.32465 Transcript_26786/m.32465 type:complete len:503 (-) Transcript_26786:195-1703(-)|eukprot:CAMPEP_0204831108 /NCGR_PEP_ID=MMETSP1346-20131115/9878_1 /ASSEMBLY_ACC=CAM_ASM_000771 /TAXON_ID=215587 /ORGANISM="Aplanochytrium stocchinoi, Strain GSBS06" /LENGTH=502 /DNA_ID=CAMNT_0051961867 /DNA_START=96 /DNA_END=1604 /DNA_ORIENTATION=+